MFGKKDAKKGKTTRPKQAEQLFKACESGRTNDVHKLLQVSGTSFHINVYNDNGLTPLHLAAESATTASDATMFNFLSICKMLLDSGADPNIGTHHALPSVCLPAILRANYKPLPASHAPLQVLRRLRTLYCITLPRFLFLPLTPLSKSFSRRSSPT